MPASSIGAYTFVSMTPQPQTAGMRLQPETKAGVSGTGFWALGVHGQEYQVQTVAVGASFSAAVAAEALYRALISAGPVLVTYGGVAIGYVIVMDVTCTAERVLQANGQGGTYYAIANATWRLIPV
jgi:hypothetical protein